MSLERFTLLSAAELPPDELERLPFGAIVIDSTGLVLLYNEYESRLSHLAKERVVGKNFFRDIAPCAAVIAFQGRLQAFLKANDPISESFAYHFPFAHGSVDVTITFVRLPRRESIMIAVERVEGGAARTKTP